MNRIRVFALLALLPLFSACAANPTNPPARPAEVEPRPMAKPAAAAAPAKPAVTTATIPPANAVVAPLPAKLPGETHPGQFAFARELGAKLGSTRPDRTESAINAILSGARYQQGIIDAMTRPAEGKAWRDYRPIFINDARINGGVAFLRENRTLLDEVSKKYGVPAEIIVAIIGVETSYGRITGSHRVLDALSTLAFHYPKRAPYFRGELVQFLSLPESTFPKPIEALQGSYAGAMGWGQFMPTSFANWAVDHDGDGQIDLWSSKPDIFASIANYFIEHGWQTGAPVVHRARAEAVAKPYVAPGLEPSIDVARLRSLGYRSETPLDGSLSASMITLEGSEGTEHWITHQNFFVISRYNRSPMYSLAVQQLAERIRSGAAGT